MMDSSNDWQCPNVNCLNHTKMVFGSKVTCPKCGAPKDSPLQSGAMYSMSSTCFGAGMPGNEQPTPERGMKGGDMPDDWSCPNEGCINHTKLVFAKRSSCPSCGTARNAKQPGDWQCPNTNCLNHKNTVFASKTVCPKCGAPRLGNSYASLMQMAGVRPTGPNNLMNALGGRFQAQFDGLLQQNRAMAMNNGGSGNPGDWQCPNPNCVNNRKMVFAKHASCPKCGAAKGPSLPCLGNGFLKQGNPGDWQCPNMDCLNNRNNVFAKHTHCPQCGMEKPGDFVAHGDRSRSPYRVLAA